MKCKHHSLPAFQGCGESPAGVLIKYKILRQRTFGVSNGSGDVFNLEFSFKEEMDFNGRGGDKGGSMHVVLSL